MQAQSAKRCTTHMGNPQPSIKFEQNIYDSATGEQRDMRKSPFSVLWHKLKISWSGDSSRQRRELCEAQPTHELTVQPVDQEDPDRKESLKAKQQEDEVERPKSTEPTNISPDKTVELKHIPRPRDWFRNGRFFSIKAEDHKQIHQKWFILLETKEKQGKGVLVEVYRTKEELETLLETSDADLTTLGLKCCKDDAHPGSHKTDDTVIRDAASGYSGSSSHNSGNTKAGRSKSDPRQTQHAEKRDEYFKDKPFEIKDLLEKLDEILTSVYMAPRVKKFVLPGSMVRLEYICSIPYDCAYADLGMLEDQSLRELQFAYIQYLVQNWGLGREVKDHKW